MTVTKSRGATKKLGPIIVGNRIIRFRVPNLDRRFTVHEDLICKTSRFFKDRLQKHRKPIFSIDECCVCAEALDATIKDISFCAKCGQNVHEDCIEAWKRSSTTNSSKELTPTCPMCRASWTNDPLLNHLDMTSELDAEAIQPYLDWLYTSTLHISSKILRNTDAFNLVILKLCGVANAMEDHTFKSQVISTYFAEARARFWKESVKWAFVERQCDDEIRDFIMDMSLTYLEPGWFKNESKDWPQIFVSELADVAMVRWKDRKDGRALKKVWMKKFNVETDIVSDDEFTAPLSGKKGSASTASGVQRDDHEAPGLDRALSGANRRQASRKHSDQTVKVTKRRLKHILSSSDDSDDDDLIVLRSR